MSYCFGFKKLKCLVFKNLRFSGSSAKFSKFDTISENLVLTFAQNL